MRSTTRERAAYLMYDIVYGFSHITSGISKMCAQYDYVKKFRALKRKRLDLSESGDSTNNSWNITSTLSDASCVNSEIDSREFGDKRSAIPVEEDNNTNQSSCIQAEASFDCSNPVASSSLIEITESFERNKDSSCTSYFSTSQWSVEHIDDEDKLSRPLSLREKLKKVCLENIAVVNNEFITKILGVLRSEGLDVPKTTTALLGTGRITYEPIRPMLSIHNSIGSYRYFGIAIGLKRRICPEIFQDPTIRVLANMDGFPVFRNSKQGFWPILMQIFHPLLQCKPFVVALWFGESKPASAEDYLEDFTAEVIFLTENGLEISGRHFNFELKAIVADTPARAFINGMKGHTGFQACERCETAGVTVTTDKFSRQASGKQSKKRIYPEIDAKRRTTASFARKDTPEHHTSGITSPLLKIPNFNIIEGVVLDYMHLLCLGVMKNLFQKWTTGRCPSRLRADKVALLQTRLESLSENVPCEFQRKKFDLNDLSNWKATQYRFFLLYSGALILRHILPKDQYRHFLLLYAACRILSDENLATRENHVDLAEKYLRTFFVILPTYYGKDSQVMNFHNLIHLADDVRYMQSAVVRFSAFPFENCLGQIKKLVRTPVDPLSQVSQRFSELEGGTDLIARAHPLFSIESKPESLSYSHERNTLNFKEIRYKNFKITCRKPNNMVLLNTGKVCLIDQIRLIEKSGRPTVENIEFAGRIYQVVDSAVTYPHQSTAIGVLRITSLYENQRIYCLAEIDVKCVHISIDDDEYAVALLHD